MPPSVSGTSVTDVCRPSRLHSVSPCRDEPHLAAHRGDRLTPRGSSPPPRARRACRRRRRTPGRGRRRPASRSRLGFAARAARPSRRTPHSRTSSSGPASDSVNAVATSLPIRSASRKPVSSKTPRPDCDHAGRAGRRRRTPSTAPGSSPRAAGRGSRSRSCGIGAPASRTPRGRRCRSERSRQFGQMKTGMVPIVRAAALWPVNRQPSGKLAIANVAIANFNGGGRCARGLVTEENKKWWTLAAVSFGLFMIMLDNTVVNVALPSIQRDLGVGPLRARMGRLRLRAHVRGADADRRQARGRLRPPAASSSSASPSSRSPRSPAASRRAATCSSRARDRAGRRGGADEPGDAVDHRRDLPAAAARHGDRHLGRRLRARARDRPARRRPPHGHASWNWIFFVNVPGRDPGHRRELPPDRRVSRPDP